MPNFSSLARLEVPEKFLWVVGGWWGLQSHFHVKPNLVLRLGWGFDNSYFGIYAIETTLLYSSSRYCCSLQTGKTPGCGSSVSSPLQLPCHPCFTDQQIMLQSCKFTLLSHLVDISKVTSCYYLIICESI